MKKMKIPIKTRINFLDKVDTDFVSNCWNWTASFCSAGYGKFGFEKVTYSAHRFSYLIYKGAINHNLYVCHTCDNKRCVNPDHLFLGTQKQNMQDSVKKGRHFSLYRGATHCKNGHKFTDDNTYLYNKNNGDPYRMCRTCILFRGKQKRQKIKSLTASTNSVNISHEEKETK